MTDGARRNDDVHVRSTNAAWVFDNKNGARGVYLPSGARRFGRHGKHALTRGSGHAVKGDDEFGQVVVVSEKVGYGHVQHQSYPEQRAGVRSVLASFVLIDPG